MNYKKWPLKLCYKNVPQKYLPRNTGMIFSLQKQQKCNDRGRGTRPKGTFVCRRGRTGR